HRRRNARRRPRTDTALPGRRRQASDRPPRRRPPGQADHRPLLMTETGGDSRRVDAARARFARVAFADTLGVAIEEVAYDRALLRLPFRPDNLNARGVLQGGASASLVTLAGTLAAWTGIDFDAEINLSCVDVSLQYLSASK